MLSHFLFPLKKKEQEQIMSSFVFTQPTFILHQWFISERKQKEEERERESTTASEKKLHMAYHQHLQTEMAFGGCNVM